MKPFESIKRHLGGKRGRSDDDKNVKDTKPISSAHSPKMSTKEKVVGFFKKHNKKDHCPSTSNNGVDAIDSLETPASLIIGTTAKPMDPDVDMYDVKVELHDVPPIELTEDMSMKDYFDHAISTASHPVSNLPNYDDIDGNQEAMRNAIACGIKVRDFAFAPEPVLGIKKLNSGAILDSRVPVFFRAIIAYYELFYMKKMKDLIGEFDVQNMRLTPIEVFRLYIIGWIKLRDVDFALGRWLLGQGLMEHLRSGCGYKIENGHKRPLYPWTIAVNLMKPTYEQCIAYCNHQETLREDPAMTLVNQYWRIHPSCRPKYDYNWDDDNYEKSGCVGLKHLGFDDETCVALLKKGDPSFIPPGSMLSFIHPAPGKDYSDYECPVKTMTFKSIRDQKLDSVPLAFAQPEPAFAYFAGVHVSGPTRNAIHAPTPARASTSMSIMPPTSVAEVVLPAAAAQPMVEPPTEPLATSNNASCTRIATSKKRARSTSPDSTADDGPVRRTRARVTRVAHEASASASHRYTLRPRRANASPSSSASSTPQRATRGRQDAASEVSAFAINGSKKGKGKKRSRDDDEEVEPVYVFESSPPKKLKAADGSSTAASPEGSSGSKTSSPDPSTPSSICNVDRDVIIGDSPLVSSRSAVVFEEDSTPKPVRHASEAGSDSSGEASGDDSMEEDEEELEYPEEPVEPESMHSLKPQETKFEQPEPNTVALASPQPQPPALAGLIGGAPAPAHTRRPLTRNNSIIYNGRYYSSRQQLSEMRWAPSIPAEYMWVLGSKHPAIRRALEPFGAGRPEPTTRDQLRLAEAVVQCTNDALAANGTFIQDVNDDMSRAIEAAPEAHVEWNDD